ncbi:MAG: hypothetical protein EP329_03130 [Deltaproteobacteria bacterium]|nr:MAG: hypothetical protein EP329_03130 [Deltaproteobacteria bacterium]
MRLQACCVATCVFVMGCVEGHAPESDQGVVEVVITALDGVEVDMVWDVEVVNGRRPVPARVWQERIVTRAGDVVAIVPARCDADTSAAEGEARVWLVGAYAPGVTEIGSFHAGGDDGVGAVIGTPRAVLPPTRADAPVVTGFTCDAAQDVAVGFDLTMVRAAEDGFFDRVVAVGELVCAARLDCCNDREGDGCASDGSEDITLLSDAEGRARRTIVLAFACAGRASGSMPTLFLDDLTLDCDPDDGVDRPDITLRPGLAPSGISCKAGPDGLSTCGDVVVEGPGVDADDFLFQLAVYRGQSELRRNNDSLRDVYWNVQLGVKDDISKCHLRARATGAEPWSAGHVEGVVDAGSVYPEIVWDAALATCAEESVTVDTTGSAPVRASYATAGAGASFDYAWSPRDGLRSVCATPCQNGGTCVAPDVCSCEGTGFSGPSCEACGELGYACADGFACTLAGTCERIESGEVWVPPGELWMGCDPARQLCGSDEGPQHRVTLSGFAIDTFEVTANAYRACVDAGACTAPAIRGGAYGTYDAAQKGDHPLTYATWDQAAAYCAWPDKSGGEQRLCTEAEWERAARGGCDVADAACRAGQRTFPWGELAPDCKRGNIFAFAGSSYCHPGRYTAQVGATPLGDSAYGVADMAGNVAEWVADWYEPGYAMAWATDPQGPRYGTERVIRGGSFADLPARVRGAARDHALPDEVMNTVGFRCCRSLE